MPPSAAAVPTIPKDGVGQGRWGAPESSATGIGAPLGAAAPLPEAGMHQEVIGQQMGSNPPRLEPTRPSWNRYGPWDHPGVPTCNHLRLSHFPSRSVDGPTYSPGRPRWI
jgi:hypothetical protein